MDKKIWREKFRKKLQDDPKALSTWRLLLVHRCDEEIVENLLFVIVQEEKEISREIEILESDELVAAYELATILKELTSQIQAGSRCFRGELQLKLLQLQKMVSITEAELTDDSQLLAYIREMYECGVALLATYCLRLTGETNYYGLDALIRCAKLESGEQYRLDAVRKAMSRFRRRHPPMLEVIKRTIDSMVEQDRRIKDSDLHTYFWEVFSNSPESGQITPSKPKVNVRDKNSVQRYRRSRDRHLEHISAENTRRVSRPTTKSRKPESL